MGRAIMAISGSAAALLPRPFIGFGQTLATYWRELRRDVLRPYRDPLVDLRPLIGRPSGRRKKKAARPGAV